MSFVSDVFTFLLPPVCALCGSVADAHERMPGIVPEGTNICSRCVSSFVPTAPDRRWFLCLSEPYEGDEHPDLKLYMPFEYDRFMSSLIHKIKFGRCSDLAAFSGRILGMIMKADKISHRSYDLIVPVPLSERRMRERGFNQAEVIARSVSEMTDIPSAGDVLVRTRHTARQAELCYGASRADNVSGAFTVNGQWDVAGLSVLLTDDVATTGNTLHEAASALYDGGAASVTCIAMCGNRIVKNVEPY